MLRTSFYFRNAGDGVLLGMSDPDQAPGFGHDHTHEWLPALRRSAARCAPSLADVPVSHEWAGLYEMTPDASARPFVDVTPLRAERFAERAPIIEADIV